VTQADYRIVKLKTPCPRCNEVMAAEILESHGPHRGRFECHLCGLFRGWVPKPETKNRPAAHRDLVAKHGNGYCELCGRNECELPASQSLEAHHVREYQDGGPPGRENLWIVCTACHELLTWARRRLGVRSQESGVRGQDDCQSNTDRCHGCPG